MIGQEKVYETLKALGIEFDYLLTSSLKKCSFYN